MPELMAYRAYSMDTLKWVISDRRRPLMTPEERVEAGTVLTLPTTAWLRERIRHYAEMETQGIGK